MAKKQKKSKNELRNTNAKVKTVAIKSEKPSVMKSNTGTQLVFGKENYKWVVIGVALIGLGMLLMIGGYNENPNEWNEASIYSMRRTTLAPIVILSGLAVQIYAIFK